MKSGKNNPYLRTSGTDDPSRYTRTSGGAVGDNSAYRDILKSKNPDFRNATVESWRMARQRQLDAFAGLGNTSIALSSAILGATIVVLAAETGDLSSLWLLQSGWVMLAVSMVSGVFRLVAHTLWAQAQITEKIHWLSASFMVGTYLFSVLTVLGLLTGILLVLSFTWVNVTQLAG